MVIKGRKKNKDIRGKNYHNNKNHKTFIKKIVARPMKENQTDKVSYRVASLLIWTIIYISNAAITTISLLRNVSD